MAIRPLCVVFYNNGLNWSDGIINDTKQSSCRLIPSSNKNTRAFQMHKNKKMWYNSHLENLRLETK